MDVTPRDCTVCLGAMGACLRNYCTGRAVGFDMVDTIIHAVVINIAVLKEGDVGLYSSSPNVARSVGLTPRSTDMDGRIVFDAAGYANTRTD